MIAIVVLVLGLVVGIVVPFFWASPLPVLLGAALLVVAGFLSKRGVLVVAAIVAAALLAVSPALINGYRNRQGIAWTVPEGEQLELAEGNLAVTSADSALRGRNLRTGDRSWELRLPDAGHTLRVWPAGPLVLTTGFDDTLRAVDAASGKVRWESPGRVTFLGVSDGEHIAVTRCGARSPSARSRACRSRTAVSLGGRPSSARASTSASRCWTTARRSVISRPGRRASCS